MTRCLAGLSTLKRKPLNPELWRKAGQQNPVFSASSCVQVLQDSSVSGPCAAALSGVLTFLSLWCSTKVPEELRDMVPYDSGLLGYYSLRTLA